MTPIFLALLIALSIPQAVGAVPRESEPGHLPSKPSAFPPHDQRVQPAVVGIKVRVPWTAPRCSRWVTSAGAGV